MRGQHHANGGAAVPIQLKVVKASFGTGGSSSYKHIDQIGFQARHDGLGFGVAHAAVELKGFDVALWVNHQTCVQEAGERNAVFFHALDGGQNDFAHGAGMHFGRDHGGWRIRAHAASVGALVGIEQALVVLAGSQWQHSFAIAHDDEAGLFTLQKLFNHHTRATFVVAHTQLVVEQHEVNRFMGLGGGHCHHHALACGQAIGLHHNRCAFGVHVIVRGLCVGESFVLRRGDVVALHERFAESLRAFQLRRCLGGAKNAQAMCAELIHHACSQWRLRPDHGQFNAMALRKLAQSFDIGDVDVVQALVACCATVAESYKHFLHLVGLRNLPRQRVLAATAANN